MLLFRSCWDLVRLHTFLPLHANTYSSDPPRPESQGAVMDSLRAGIVVRMLTGDHVCQSIAYAFHSANHDL